MSNFQLVPGSVPHAAVVWIRAQGREVTTAEIGAVIERTVRRVAQHLSPALHAGLLVRRKDAATGVAYWRASEDEGATPPQENTHGGNRAGDVRQVLRMSAAAAPSVFAYADQRGAAPFAVSIYTDGRMHIERHGRLLLELTEEERQQLLRHARLV